MPILDMPILDMSIHAFTLPYLTCLGMCSSRTMQMLVCAGIDICMYSYTHAGIEVYKCRALHRYGRLVWACADKCEHVQVWI